MEKSAFVNCFRLCLRDPGSSSDTSINCPTSLFSHRSERHTESCSDDLAAWREKPTGPDMGRTAGQRTAYCPLFVPAPEMAGRSDCQKSIFSCDELSAWTGTHCSTGKAFFSYNSSGQTYLFPAASAQRIHVLSSPKTGSCSIK